jgi:hypothetical protein
MIAQDADVEQCLPWTGVGYGFFGGGHAFFEPYYTRSADPSQPDMMNPIGAAWQISGQFLFNMTSRVPITGCDEGFAGLAGMSSDRKQIAILLSNYQVSDELLRDLNEAYYRAMDKCCQESNYLAGGLLAGEYYQFQSPPAPPGLALTGPRPSFGQNRTDNYGISSFPCSSSTDVLISSLPRRSPHHGATLDRRYTISLHHLPYQR